MSKTKTPPPQDKPTTKRKKRGARGPGRTDDERIAAIEADQLRLRERAKAQLIRAAEQAGLFDYHFTTPELRTLLKDALGREARPISMLQKRKREIVQIKTRKQRSQRADDARRKALLGGFMVAQFRHKPDIHAQLAPDLYAHLAAHPKPRMAEANIAFMAAVLSDPSGVEDTEPETAVTGISQEQARRNQTRRMILVGAWALDRRSEMPAIEALIQGELAAFLKQDRAPARNIALLKDVLGVF